MSTTGQALAHAKTLESGGPMTILLVDDEAQIRMLGKVFLTRLGHKVHVAEDGAAALAIYEQELGRIDVVILDLAMPGLTGEQTFQRLAQLDPHARVLIATGSHEVSPQLSTHPCYAGLLAKPYQPTNLWTAIHAALELADHAIS